MTPVKFKECNATYAKDQPQYKPLPVLKTEDGYVVSCWKLNIIERIKILFAGKIWLGILTFNKPLQPIIIDTKKVFMKKGINNGQYGKEA